MSPSASASGCAPTACVYLWRKLVQTCSIDINSCLPIRMDSSKVRANLMLTVCLAWAAVDTLCVSSDAHWSVPIWNLFWQLIDFAEVFTEVPLNPPSKSSVKMWNLWKVVLSTEGHPESRKKLSNLKSVSPEWHPCHLLLWSELEPKIL